MNKIGVFLILITSLNLVACAPSYPKSTQVDVTDPPSLYEDAKEPYSRGTDALKNLDLPDFAG